MGKVSFKDDPASSVQIFAPDEVVQGSPAGLAWDQLGGLEFRRDVILFPESDVQDFLLLEDETGRIVLEDGTGYILIDQESDVLWNRDLILAEDGFTCFLLENGSGHLNMEVDYAG